MMIPLYGAAITAQEKFWGAVVSFGMPPGVLITGARKATEAGPPCAMYKASQTWLQGLCGENRHAGFTFMSDPHTHTFNTLGSRAQRCAGLLLLNRICSELWLMVY